MPIIKSLLDTDWYTFTMASLVLHQHPGAMVEYAYKCRNGTGIPYDDPALAQDFVSEMNEELDAFCELRFTHDELEYLSKTPYFRDDYLEYLRLFQPNRKYVECWTDNTCNLQLRVPGPWISTIWFEQPCLAINSQLYHEHLTKNRDFLFNVEIEAKKRLEAKIKFLNDIFKKEVVAKYFHFADFGTRRRWSFDWQDYVIGRLVESLPEGMFVGTSNAYFAKKYGIKVVGTMAHQLFQAFQQLGGRLKDHQKACLDAWTNEFRGELGIALSDTVGFEAFLKDFDLYFAKLFDGCRQDSGDPVWWANKLIKHYQKLGIDPKTKLAVFSDGLTFERAFELHKMFYHTINTSAGIGTYLTNDTPQEAMQIVMKLVKCNGAPTAKISDSEGKGMCEDLEFERYLRYVFDR
jgi:nicotinate phosphoribosyltransferase